MLSVHCIEVECTELRVPAFLNKTNTLILSISVGSGYTDRSEGYMTDPNRSATLDRPGHRTGKAPYAEDDLANYDPVCTICFEI